MSEQKNSFILFREYEEDFISLTNEQAGLVIKAIFAYENGHELPELDSESAMLFRVIRRQLERTDTAYKQKSANNSRAANIRWEKERAEKSAMQMHANASNAMHNDASDANASNAMPPDSVPDSVPDSDPKKKEECLTTLSEKRRDENEILDRWNTLPDPIPKIRSIVKDSKREKMLKTRLEEYGKDAVLDAIEKVRQSDFLCGRKADWHATFDWFVAPSNFIKVIEGNYNNSPRDNMKVVSPRDYLLNVIKGEDNDETGDGEDLIYDSHLVSEQFFEDRHTDNRGYG